MKKILLFIIRCYWKCVPESFRRRCIFKQSCSCYVHERTQKAGFIEGIKALRQRIKQCRPGYQLCQTETGHWFVLLNSGEVVPSETLRDDLFIAQ
jgi:putative component of membrane protein insertase Oxa1/YidC/SpoIIIJ protein YidD